MKKIALSALVVLVFAAYIWHQKTDTEEVQVIPPATTNTSAASPIPTSSTDNSSNNSQSPTSALNPTQTAIAPTQPPAPSGAFKNGEYTSEVGDAFYGPLQIKVIVADGKISDVTFLQYPNDRPTSREINSQAMPFLRQETIQSQNANVDVITGATQTSDAFKTILQSTLDKAKA